MPVPSRFQHIASVLRKNRPGPEHPGSNLRRSAGSRDPGMNEVVIKKTQFLSILQVVYICLYHFGSNFECIKWHPQWPMERLSLDIRCVVSQALRSSPKDWRYSGSLDDAAVMGRESCCVFCLWVSLKIGCQHLDIIWFLYGFYPFWVTTTPIESHGFIAIFPCSNGLSGVSWTRPNGPGYCIGLAEDQVVKDAQVWKKQHRNRGSAGCVEKWWIYNDFRAFLNEKPWENDEHLTEKCVCNLKS